MEEDWKKIPSQKDNCEQRMKECEERKKKIEQQKLSGKKESNKKSKDSATKGDGDEVSFVLAGRSDDESTVAPKQSAKSKSNDEQTKKGAGGTKSLQTPKNSKGPGVNLQILKPHAGDPVLSMPGTVHKEGTPS
eukprot:scaffold1265_cov38-Cyclotella_meneghiniana.AAC.13